MNSHEREPEFEAKGKVNLEKSKRAVSVGSWLHRTSGFKKNVSWRILCFHINSTYLLVNRLLKPWELNWVDTVHC